MIDVVIADHQELFHAGIAEVLAVADDVRIVGQPQCPEQLLSTLKEVASHVLVLSTSFLPAFSQIQGMLKPRRTALLVLAEDGDRIAYQRWLGARGIVYRSVEGPALVDAMRRVARGELFVQNRSSDFRQDRYEVTQERTKLQEPRDRIMAETSRHQSRAGSDWSRSRDRGEQSSKQLLNGLKEVPMVLANRIPVVLSVDENSAILYARYKVLQGAGYGALSAIDGKQALSMFEAYPVDLVLLDYAMPGTDGKIFVRKIKRCKPNVPIIAVSLGPAPEDILTLGGVDCFLAKGADPAVLLERIGELLSRERGLEIAND